MHNPLYGILPGVGANCRWCCFGVDVISSWSHFWLDSILELLVLFEGDVNWGRFCFWVEAIWRWHFGVDTFWGLCLFGVEGISGLMSTELNAYLELRLLAVDGAWGWCHFGWCLFGVKLSESILGCMVLGHDDVMEFIPIEVDAFLVGLEK